MIRLLCERSCIVVNIQKSELRKEIRTKRETLSKEQVMEKSQNIFNQLYKHPLYKSANTIMTYVSIGKEVDTHNFIQRAIKEGKRIVVPVCKPETREMIASHIIDFENDLQEGYWGLLEPKKETLRAISSNEIDLILVPGLAFTKSGHRLGHGGGYYDRFLSSLTRDVPSIALAYELQLVDHLPVEDFDLPMKYIMTEKEFIKCR